MHLVAQGYAPGYAPAPCKSHATLEPVRVARGIDVDVDSEANATEAIFGADVRWSGFYGSALAERVTAPPTVTAPSLARTSMRLGRPISSPWRMRTCRRAAPPLPERCRVLGAWRGEQVVFDVPIVEAGMNRFRLSGA